MSFVVFHEFENIEEMNGAVWKEAVYGILLIRKNIEGRVQSRQHDQVNVNPAEIQELQFTAGSAELRGAIDQGAQPIFVNFLRFGEIEDDIDGPGFRQRHNRIPQGGFRLSYDQAAAQVENPNPFLLALVDFEIHG
jgi:hypothetical protein